MINIIYVDEVYQKQKIINNISGISKKIYFDINENSLNKIYSEIASIDLFNEKKKYILENIDIFELKNSKLKKNDKFYVDKLLNLDIDLIIINRNKLNLNSTYYLKYVDKIKYYEVLKTNMISELNGYIKINKIKITDDAINLLLNYHDNISGLLHDLDKINQYLDYQLIDVNVVKEIGLNSVVYQIFELYNYLFTDKFDEGIKYLKILEEQGNDQMKIFLVYISQLKKYYYIKNAMYVYTTNKEIADNLHLNVYFIQNVRKILKNISLFKLEQYIIIAANIDYQVKSGIIYPNQIMNMIFMENMYVK